ncbi:hypothetical protein [Streptomyces regalis]|uniref:Uncharacterized protein n=1 Tax=Streptomyces regalis TaxID=68262 RepID=A0A0X3VNL0_9ACTN|nr:hypothetical protein [Streptomyces regalis]KUL46339.1 hypothetical protein ADL12_02415 [Streptomyces regalis]
MTDGPSAAEGGRYEVHVNDVSGQLVVGSYNTVTYNEGVRAAPTPVTEAQLAELHAQFIRLRSAVAELGEVNRSAEERLDELEEAVTSAEPDVSVMVYVRNWFLRTLPALAGTVTALIADPVVGQLVQQAGDQLALEYDRHFGTHRPESPASDR